MNPFILINREAHYLSILYTQLPLLPSGESLASPFSPQVPPILSCLAIGPPALY